LKYILLQKELLSRARLWDCMSSVCPFVHPWRWGMFFTQFGILPK